MALLSSSLSPLLHTPENGEPEVVRPSADFHPSIWGDHFMAYSHDEQKLDAQKKSVEELKQQVKAKLKNINDSVQELNFIDAIQRLGVGYHFENKIEESLQKIYNDTNEDDISDDLHTVALKFRLLRQQGFKVSSDVFNKFKDQNGNFKESLSNDPRGLLSLYEASNLSVHDEDILDEALTFASDHLKRLKQDLCSTLGKQVGRALSLPLRRAMSRLEARHYISAYEEEEEKDDVLLELAKLDFNLLQSLHQIELKEVTRWWNDLDFATKLPHVRNRIVECYFWILGVYHEPQYARGRMTMLKMISITSALDDTYDAYGTYEELQLLTDAIQRWDYEAMDQVPEYMRVLFLALLDSVVGYEDIMTPQEKSYRIHYVKETMKALTKAYFAEAKWLHDRHVPTLEEHLGVSVISSGYPMLCVMSFVGMGEEATKEAFDWVISVPKLVWDLSLMSRLRDDIQSQEFEQQRDHIPSSLHIYMKENGVSEEEARKRFREMISDVWKGINEACLKPTTVAVPLITRLLNLSGMAEVIYQHGDGYSDSRHETKDNITLLLVKPVPL